MKFLLINTILICWMLVPGAEVETIDFTIEAAGFSVGTIRVQKEIQGKQTIYKMDSNAQIRFFGKRTVVSSAKAIFEDGILISSQSKAYRNGKLNEEASLTKEGDHYLAIYNGESKTINHPIHYSGIMLFFEEPASTHQVYSEPEAKIKSIKSISIDTYLLSDPDKGQENTYTYAQDKRLQKATIEHKIINFKLSRKE